MGVHQTRKGEFSSKYFYNMWPMTFVEQGVIDKALQLVAKLDAQVSEGGQLDEKLKTLKRHLNEQVDEMQRALRCREFAKAAEKVA